MDCFATKLFPSTHRPGYTEKILNLYFITFALKHFPERLGHLVSVWLYFKLEIFNFLIINSNISVISYMIYTLFLEGLQVSEDQ